ncbi:protein decapping 5 [Phalaenopsis equestris]|uniref:protein decapping 5 n=1 Tax=Phalaenopsis equestris TaxID=78828 RepID=UPI0009E531E9|nr:protein decapping 5 [Phalaenopsis equestris]
MAAESSRSSPSADSYIGSLITLTSKSEIRYEGILYNINTEESSIGLRNVRSFGTEGRKKDGSQVPASDKIYEYILFRGSDIKDLQVKASPPVQTTPAHNDPAIIQSHYPRPQAAPSSLPPLGTGATPELSSHSGQVGLQHPTFQGSLPQYPTGGNLGTWGPTPPPPNANGSGLAVPPMFWQGYYAPSGGIPHLQQPSLMRPLPGLAMPPMQQTLQFQGMNAPLSSGTPSYPEFSPLFSTVNSNMSLNSTALPSTLPSFQATSFSTEMSQSSVSIKGPVTTVLSVTPSGNLPAVSQSSVSVKGPITSLPSVTPSGSLPSVSPLTPNMDNFISVSQNIPPVVSGKSRISSITSMAHQTETQSIPLSLGSSSSNQAETSTKLVTPGQLMQPNPSVLPSSQTLEKTLKVVEIKPHEDKSKPLLPEPVALQRETNKARLPSVAKESILPLPTPAYHKPNGAISVGYESNRGRGRGRGSGYPRPQATTFTEDFDFTAMNEKFNKDEVWGHLGKSRPHSSNIEEDDEAYGFEEENRQSVEFDVKPVYVKDDFFDSLSSNSNDQTSNGRIKFSEQLKIDTETFGNFSRPRSAYRGGRGVRGGRGRGSYYGRGYGYSGRGRGYPGTSRDS